VARDLPFEPVGDLVESRFDVGSHPLRPEGLPGGVTGHFHPMIATDPGVSLLDQLDVEANDAGLQAFELGQFVLCGPANLIGDSHAPSLEHQIHRVSFRLLARERRPPKGAPAWLTWSLTPHPPAEGFAAEEAA
jgi:hypothetical protein